MEVVFVKKKREFLKNCEQEKNWSVHPWGVLKKPTLSF
jgi:hypothetical protein